MLRTFGVKVLRLFVVSAGVKASSWPMFFGFLPLAKSGLVQYQSAYMVDPARPRRKAFPTFQQREIGQKKKTIPLMVLGTRVLRYWLLGPSGW